MSLDEIGKELRGWIDGENNPKLDKWLGEYGKDFIGNTNIDKKSKEVDEKSKNDNKSTKKINDKETKPKDTKKVTKKPKETKSKLPKFKKPEAYKRYYGYQMSEWHNEWAKSLSNEQKEAIKKYTNQGWYSVINKKLRSGAKLTDSDTDKILKDLFDNVSGALATNKIPKNMQVYRGSSASIFKDLLSEDLYKQMRSSNADINELKDKLLGTIMKDDAYMSTTIIDDVSFHKSSGFLKNVLFKIDIDKNATGAGYIAELSEIPLECELLLDKGTKLYIKDITWNESFEAYEISCHYLGQ
jgi:superfamily II RNA helicase